MIKVLVCRIGQAPVVEEIDSGLEAMQKIVGGYIENLRLEDGVDLWCNEEGSFTQKVNRVIPARAPELPPGYTVDDIIKTDPNLADPGEMGVHRIHGDFFIARTDEEGASVSLTEEDISKYVVLMTIYQVCPQCGKKPPAYLGAVYCGAGCSARAGA
jgi:hypothetical protein